MAATRQPAPASPDSRDQDSTQRLKEADIDPSGEVSSERESGTTENPGTLRGNNQPAESTEPASRETAADRETESIPRPGQQE